MRCLLLFTIGIAVASGANGKDFKRQYDRFKDRTSYAFESELASGTPSITWSLDIVTEGQKPFGKESTAGLQFIVTYDMSSPKALDCVSGVDLLVDGKPWKIDQTMPPLFYGKHAIATYGKKLSFGSVQELANSDLLEIRACGKEFAVEGAKLDEVRQFLAFAATRVPQQNALGDSNPSK